MVVKIGTQRANANIFVSTIGTMLCSAAFLNGDNERINLNMQSNTETCHHLYESKSFKVKLRSMRLTDHMYGTPSEARGPRLVSHNAKYVFFKLFL